MPGKKDAKKDTKKGGKPEPVKKEDEKKGKDVKDDPKNSKDDKKGGKDDKKSGKVDKKGNKDDKKGNKEDKKGSKDDVKGGKKGKDEPSKGKDVGKNKKDKGKSKKVESEEEEEELLSDEEDEEEESEKDEEEEDEEDSEEDRRGKRRGGREDRGRKRGKSRHAEESEEDEDEEEEEEDEEDEDEDFGKSKRKHKDGRHHKGEKTQVDGKKKRGKNKEEALEVEKKKIPTRGLKNMSRMFMKFSGFKRRRNSRKKLKTTSRLFLGLGKRKFRLARKKRRKSILKNTSRFMMRFKVSKKKKKEKEAKEKAAANSGSKPTFLLLRLGGRGETAEKKGGFFKGLFGKKSGKWTTDDLKNRSMLLGKVAAATNWLTKRFLTSKMRGGNARRGWGGQGKLGRELSDRGHLHGYQNGGYDHEDETFGYNHQYTVHQRGHRGYDENYDGYVDETTAAYGDQSQFGYFENGVGVADYQDLGYYEEEGLFDPNAEYYEGMLYDEGTGEYYEPSANGYYSQDADYYAYQQQTMDMHLNEGLDYYAQMDGVHMYGGDLNGFINPHAQGYYDENNEGLYYNDRQTGFYENPYATNMELQGEYSSNYQQNYGDVAMAYQDYSSQQPTGYQHTGHDFGFGTQGLAQMQGHYGNQYASQLDQYGNYSNETQGGEMAFRLPRPQVRLFGKERLDVPLPPPPTLPPDPEFEGMSDIQYEDQIPLAPDHPIDPMVFHQPVGIVPQEQMMSPQNSTMFSEPQSMLPPLEQMMIPQNVASPQLQMTSPHQQVMFQEQILSGQMLASPSLPTQQIIVPEQNIIPQQMMLPQQPSMAQEIMSQQPHILQQQMMSTQGQIILPQQQMASPQMMSPQVDFFLTLILTRKKK